MNKIVLFIMFVMMSACTWSGYVDDRCELVSRQTMQKITSKNGKISVSFYLINLNQNQQNYFKAALQEVLDIFDSDGFKGEVEGFHGWMARVNEDSSKVNVLGENLYSDIISSKYENLQILANKPTNAIAVTDTTPCGEHHGIVISPSQLNKWGGGIKSKAELIETLSHELMHVIPDDCMCIKYMDRGHNKINQLQLVSYRVGKLTACMYLKKEGKIGGLDSCLK